MAAPAGRQGALRDRRQPLSGEDAERCCSSPHAQKNPLPHARCISGWGAVGRQACWGLLSSWCRAQAASGVGLWPGRQHRGGGSAAWAAGGNWATAISVRTRTVAPGHPHGTLSTQTQCLEAGENEGQINSVDRLPLLPGGLPTSVKTEQERHPAAHPDLNHQAQLHQRNARHPAFT